MDRAPRRNRRLSAGARRAPRLLLRGEMRRAVAIGILLVAGCHGAAWVPDTPVGGRLRGTGLPSAVYKLPDGTVSVAAVGVRGSKGARQMVVRMSVENRSDGVFRLQPEQQRLLLPGYRESWPLPPRDGTRVVLIPPRSERLIELSFPVADARPARFDLEWRLATPGEPVEHRTPFDRSELGPFGWGPPFIGGWYYAPPYYALDFTDGSAHGFPPTVERQTTERPRPVHGRRVHVVPSRPPIEAPPPQLAPWPTTP